MTRYEIRARKVGFTAYTPLFRDERNYKTEAYAKRVMKEQQDYYPELEMIIKPVEVHRCLECGTRLIDR